MWFIVMLAFVGGQQVPMENVSGFKFKTWYACMKNAKVRMIALRSAGGSGRALCMRRGMSDAELRKTPIVFF